MGPGLQGFKVCFLCECRALHQGPPILHHRSEEQNCLGPTWTLASLTTLDPHLYVGVGFDRLQTYCDIRSDGAQMKIPCP